MMEPKGPSENSTNEDGMDYLVLLCTLFHNLTWPLGLVTYMHFLGLPSESDSSWVMPWSWYSKTSASSGHAVQWALAHDPLLRSTSHPPWACWFSSSLSLPLTTNWSYFPCLSFSLSKEDQITSIKHNL